MGHWMAATFAWMFEDRCLFYKLANFYREQSNLKGIFRVEVFVSPVSERESAAFVFILCTCDDSRAAYSVKSPRGIKDEHIQL